MLSIRQLILVSYMVPLSLAIHPRCFAQAIEVKPEENPNSASAAPDKSEPASAEPIKSSSAIDYSKIEKALNEKYDGRINSSPKPARIYLSILHSGLVQWLYVYNSCGLPEIDEAVKQSVSSIEKFQPNEKFLTALAVLPPRSKVIKIIAVPDINWNDFMTKIQADIKQNWNPPEGTRTKIATARFRINTTGEITEFRFETPTEEPLFDRAAKKAVDKLGPRTFPTEAPDNVEIRFTFTYHVDRTNKSLSKILLPRSDKLIARAIIADKADPPAHTGTVPNPKTLNNEGVDATNAKKFDLAISKLKAAVLADSRYHLAQQNLAVAYNNRGLAKKGDPQQALTQFHRAYFFEPESTTTFQNVEGTVKLIGKSPNSFDDRKLLGTQAEAKSDYIGALVEYAAANTILQDPDVCIRMGDIYARYGAKDLALTQYLLAKKLDDTRADARIAKLKPTSTAH
ncbi:MAG: TonB C-terminal domain-containing protein [Candidatus Obscuribacterales bacterium]|nr:TonB C-terminal domain-containing protein [Candidatus Obscuribacterales bacterium]